MSLARAFTVRRNKNVESSPAPYIGRAASQRSPNAKPVTRNEISLPVALISTTNMLSYEAPNIAGTRRVPNTDRISSSSISFLSDASSGDESDRSSTSAHSNETAATSVDGSAPNSPEQNHLSCYFKPSVKTSTAVSTRSSQSTFASSRPSIDSPQLPQRAPSHTKKAHALSHKRSVQRMGAQPIHERQISRSSVDMFSNKENIAPASSHPFGKELEQLHEVAEEFGSAVRNAEADEDRDILLSRGLAQFCASDYMNEIESMYSTVFAEDAAVYQPMAWI